ncbi:hypothetical protein CIB48_g8624 [Xylaria polymorpha]|nr:hypothetical protein CIB48_g8624 [Xylaria polymorpha]
MVRRVMAIERRVIYGARHRPRFQGSSAHFLHPVVVIRSGFGEASSISLFVDSLVKAIMGKHPVEARPRSPTFGSVGRFFSNHNNGVVTLQWATLTRRCLLELLACLEHASVVFDGPDSNAAIVLVQWANPMKEMLVENTGVGCIPAVCPPDNQAYRNQEALDQHLAASGHDPEGRSQPDTRASIAGPSNTQPHVQSTIRGLLQGGPVVSASASLPKPAPRAGVKRKRKAAELPKGQLLLTSSRFGFDKRSRRDNGEDAEDQPKS